MNAWLFVLLDFAVTLIFSREFCMCRIAGAWAPDFLELEEKAARIWGGRGGSGGEWIVGNKYTYRLNRAYA